ncbi:phosphoinositide phosphatase SAC1 (SAC1) [Vairimorpha necatrix]|uniref:Phosphoinositide phosphatase SAC1 (SAC1) n=1 Tax=Vairimorpha necatrix TaxID=6039 RepID=A0AAX4J8F7_9MICR
MFKVKILNKKMKISSIKKVHYNVISENIEFFCYGIYGKIDIMDSQYIIFITEVIKNSQNFYSDVFEISKVKIIHLQGPGENSIVKNIKKTLEKSGIYFSYQPLYNNYSMEDNNNSNREDFIFNYVPIENLKKFDKKLKKLTKKCIQGYFNGYKIDNMQLILISRRCWKNCGARYFCRGSNPEGYVSNYVETEQIIKIGMDIVYSYLQIRGSIPLIWSHRVGLAYAPPIVISKNELNKECFIKSIEILQKKYKFFFYINLIKQNGYEGELNKEFKKFQDEKNFMNLDFHNSGIISNKEKFDKFILSVKNVLDKFGEKMNDKYQKGVIRTNCIDCLDRTNLVQYYIGRYNIEKNMKNVFNKIKFHLGDLWYENGNKISLQYAGTPAIKANVIKNTKQDFTGLIRDFYFSIVRYFLNRWRQGDLQDCYDILTGKFYINGHYKKPRYSKYFLVIIMLFISILSFKTSSAYFYIFFLGFTVILLLISKMNYPKTLKKKSRYDIK